MPEQLNDYHPIIGLVLLALLGLQPIIVLFSRSIHAHFPHIPHRHFGCLPSALHHNLHIHLWLSRLLVTLGILNGGLGFQFASTFPGPSAPVGAKIAYGALATLVWIVYVAVVAVWAGFRRPPSSDRPPARRARLGDELAVLGEPRGRREGEVTEVSTPAPVMEPETLPVPTTTMLTPAQQGQEGGDGDRHVETKSTGMNG